MDRHELLRYVLDQVDVPVLATDADGRVVYTNHAFASLHDTPAPGAPFEEWRRNYRFLRADGVTPLDPDQIPLRMILRGERVHNHRYATLDKHGCVRYRRANGQALVDSDGTIVGAVLAIVDITEQQHLVETLRRQVLVDPLTGLTGRPLLVDRLGRALLAGERTGSPLGIVFVDLLDFRAVNTTFGHEVGDEVLVELANRLRAAALPTDTVARTGGDDFVVLRDAVAGHDELEELARALHRTLAVPVEAGGAVVHPSLAISHALLGGSDGVTVRDGDDLDGLLRDMAWRTLDAPDVATGAAAGEVLHTRRKRRAELEQATADALDDDNLQVWYQPIVDARTHQIVGVEALVRCVDPALGLISPTELVPAGQHLGVLGRIDEWVLRQAAAQVAEWSTLPLSGELRLNCNASAALLTRDDLIDVVGNAVVDAGLAPTRLFLETTEAELSRAEARVREAVEHLTRRGVAVGLDDFGTGWSSLTRLRSLPVRFVKLDRAFVADSVDDERGRRVLGAVVELAHALGLSVTAEGVELPAPAAVLAELGCDHLQGYLFSPPLPPAEVEDLLLRRPATTAPTTS